MKIYKVPKKTMDDPKAVANLIDSIVQQEFNLETSKKKKKK